MSSTSRLVERLEKLRQQRRAVILAHNYMPPEVQDVADFIGDSLELALKAAEASADVIVVAGVNFMAEVAKLLNPEKIVLHPEPQATCPLAGFLTPAMLRDARRRYNAPILLYVNSYASAKAEADYVVTSASAVEAARRLSREHDTLVFSPDYNLADWVQERVPQARIIPVPSHGYCPVHEFLVSEYHVLRAREEHPTAKVLVHPEAPRSARRLADYVGSTSQMLRYISEADPRGEYVLGTEEGLVYRAKRLYPEARVYPVTPKAVCIDMKKITLEKIVQSLDTLKPQVSIPSRVAVKAREAIERGLELVGKKPG